MLFEELSELAGQRNAIDGRIVEIVAEMDRDKLCGATGARSIAELVAWKLGWSSANAKTITTVAGRLRGVSPLHRGLREGRLSLDQVGVIAARAADGSDEHYAQLAAVATVNQLRTAVKLEPRPEPDPRPEPQRSITKTGDEQSTCWRITLPHDEAATFDAALKSHREALITEWKHDHDTETPRSSGRRCRTPWMRSCVWSRPAGTPKPPAARTASTPPWWCTSTSRRAPPPCIWVRCSPTPNANT